ncbi:MAG: hypothetical protein HN368_04735 [Spirochaetales bacterium]|nr:hypothetical protein [Spirochaetales bacterium]
MKIFLFSVLCSSLALSLFAQDIDMDSVKAEEEFHWGVSAFHNSLYGESIRAFERALSFTPDDYLLQEWLGRAYYQSGYEETAVNIWSRVVEAGAGGPILRNLIDTVQARRGLNRELAEDERYVNAFALDGKQEDFVLFAQPSSVRSRGDGSFYVTSFVGNQVVRFTLNGALQRRLLGGLQGLDGPFDVLEVDENHVFITEFLGNRIFRSNTIGTDIVRWGEKGISDGQLLGPQFLAVDNRGYLYVTEAGNHRVSKFDFDGNFILSFGEKDQPFGGLKLPTGIFVYNETVFVADAQEKHIAAFDLSGNFLYTFGKSFLDGPEGLSLFEEGILLVADTRRVLTYHIDSQVFTVIAEFGGLGTRITNAARDVNGDILVVDFFGNTVTLLTDISDIYTGLFVQVERILSRDYPDVYVEISVQDRMGDPYIGLDESNFILSELRSRVRNDSFLIPEESAVPSVALLVDRSLEMRTETDSLRLAAEDIYAMIRGSSGKLALVSTEELPQIVESGGSGAQGFSQLAAEFGNYSDAWRFSLGARLAVSEVLSWPGQRAVVFVTAGDPGSLGFDDYDLDILAAYMRNNDVAFYCIYTRPDPVRPEEFEYLSEMTGGASAFMYQPEGITPLIKELLNRRSGRYFFSYESVSDTNFGDRYLTMEAEVFHFDSSGRSETGYFAPRE